VVGLLGPQAYLPINLSTHQPRVCGEFIGKEVNKMTENGNGTKRIFNRMVKGGRRTYFVSVKESKNNKKYITLTESKVVGDGKFDRFNIMLFPEKVGDLVQALQEAEQAAA
jgi:hypothetical protein